MKRLLLLIVILFACQLVNSTTINSSGGSITCAASIGDVVAEIEKAKKDGKLFYCCNSSGKTSGKINCIRIDGISTITELQVEDPDDGRGWTNWGVAIALLVVAAAIFFRRK